MQVRDPPGGCILLRVRRSAYASAVADTKASVDVFAGTIEIIADCAAGTGQHSHENPLGLESSGKCTMISAFKLGVVTKLCADGVNGNECVAGTSEMEYEVCPLACQEIRGHVRP